MCHADIYKNKNLLKTSTLDLAVFRSDTTRSSQLCQHVSMPWIWAVLTVRCSISDHVRLKGWRKHLTFVGPSIQLIQSNPSFTTVLGLMPSDPLRTCRSNFNHSVLEIIVSSTENCFQFWFWSGVASCSLYLKAIIVIYCVFWGHWVLKYHSPPCLLSFCQKD